MKSAYMRFLSLARMATGLPGMPPLDPVEERLLRQFASFWGNDYQPTVLEALEIDEGISRRTVQRRIDGLRGKGMIRYEADPTDQRIKRIAPTDLAEKYFSRYDLLLKSAVRNAGN
jgi:DNA-binding MarR family transcriptional regulator